jgi:hypothetical protein
MNEPAPADEVVVETEPEIDPNLSLNPHMGTGEPEPTPDGEQAPTGDDQDGETPAPGEETAEPKPDDDALQRKVGELAYENRQLRRELEAKAAAAEPEDDTPAEPLKTLKDFNYDEQAFNEYLVEETSARTAKKLARTQAQSAGQTEAQRRADEFGAREDAFEAEHPGFKERMHKDDLMISPEMAMFIADPTSEVGLHVGDYLSQNPTEAAKIAGMNPTTQMREMIKLESRIGKEVKKAAAAKTETSKAPKPPANALDGTDPGVSGDPANPADADKMSDDEWLQRRNKQLEERRKRK